MPEPTIVPDWQNLNFRRAGAAHHRHEAGARFFVIGVSIFLATALIYPWYSYLVHAKLDQWAMQSAMATINAQLKVEAAKVARDMAQQREAAGQRDQQQRLRGVAITGVSLIRGQRLVIVSLGTAKLAEAVPTICRQAQMHFKAPMAGERLRVQVQAGNRPAMDAGTILCP